MGGRTRANARLWVEQFPRYTTTLGIGAPLVSGPQTVLPEVSDAEPAPSKRPPNWPAFWEYKLKDVQLEDCDVVVPDAPEQVGGYVDWHVMAGGGSYGEQLFNYTCPGIYESFKPNADGMKDPVTGECNGISMAYEVDAIPAFITQAGPKQPEVRQAGTRATVK